MTTTTNTPAPFKTVTKIVTFYSDGTFTEYTPAAMPFTPVPYTPPPYNPSPYPWWHGPVSYGNSQGFASPTEGKSE